MFFIYIYLYIYIYIHIPIHIYHKDHPFMLVNLPVRTHSIRHFRPPTEAVAPAPLIQEVVREAGRTLDPWDDWYIFTYMNG